MNYGRVRLFVIPEGTKITEEPTSKNPRPESYVERIVRPGEGLAYDENALIWQPNDEMYCFGSAGDIGTYGLGKDPKYLWVLKKDVIEKDKQVQRCAPPNYPKIYDDPKSNYYNEDWVNAYILS